jgi:hypothetical protein
MRDDRRDAGRPGRFLEIRDFGRRQRAGSPLTRVLAENLERFALVYSCAGYSERQTTCH